MSEASTSVPRSKRPRRNGLTPTVRVDRELPEPSTSTILVDDDEHGLYASSIEDEGNEAYAQSIAQGVDEAVEHAGGGDTAKPDSRTNKKGKFIATHG